MRPLAAALLFVWLPAALAQDNSASSSGAATTLEAVFDRLAGIETLRGEFSQQRTVPGLSAPLDSGGRFIVSDRGLYWEQAQPFRSVLIADDERLVQIIRDQEPRTISASDQPVAAGIGTVFLSVFRGNREALEEHFEVSFESEGADWTVSLTPAAYPLTETISELRLHGRYFIEEMSLTGTADDILTVQFHELRDEPSVLEPGEVALYSP